jgi:hypothetical protein
LGAADGQQKTRSGGAVRALCDVKVRLSFRA